MDLRKGVVVSRTNLVDSKKEVAIPWKGIGVVFFITLTLWGAAFYYDFTTKNQINTIQNNLNILKQNRDYQKIALVTDSEERLKSLNELVTNRADWEKVFRKLEENTIPEVTFSFMNAKLTSDNVSGTMASTSGVASVSSTNNKCRLDLKGSTIGLSNLSKQILAFEGNTEKDKINPDAFAKEVLIQKIDVKKTDAGEGDTKGALDFAIQADLNPNIFKTSIGQLGGPEN